MARLTAYRRAVAQWYLNSWLKHFGKRQADAARELEWNKAKVSLTASGKQPYTRDDVQEVAEWLGIQPYELLMRPQDALAIHEMRQIATQLLKAGVVPDLEGEEFSDIKLPEPRPDRQIRKRTGTHG